MKKSQIIDIVREQINSVLTEFQPPIIKKEISENENYITAGKLCEFLNNNKLENSSVPVIVCDSDTGRQNKVTMENLKIVNSKFYIDMEW